jgi:hypothetical protein
MVLISLHYLTPLQKHIAGGHIALEAQSPAWVLRPREIPKLVGPVMEAFLKYLLVQSGAVKSSLHSKLNISS